MTASTAAAAGCNRAERAPAGAFVAGDVGDFLRWSGYSYRAHRTTRARSFPDAGWLSLADDYLHKLGHLIVGLFVSRAAAAVAVAAGGLSRRYAG